MFVSDDLSGFTSSTPIPALSISPIHQFPFMEIASKTPVGQATATLGATKGLQPNSDATDNSSEAVIDPVLLASDVASSSLSQADQMTQMRRATLEQVPLKDLVTYTLSLEKKLEVYESQLLIQDMYCSKMQKKLYFKEIHVKTQKEQLADEGKCDMTAPEWI